MFISNKFLSLFEIAKDHVADLKTELASVKTERDFLKAENINLKVGQEWMRHKINSLEVERAALLGKAYNLTLPVPEIGAKRPTEEITLANMSPFDHIDDDTARKLGIEHLLS